MDTALSNGSEVVESKRRLVRHGGWVGACLHPRRGYILMRECREFGKAIEAAARTLQLARLDVVPEGPRVVSDLPGLGGGEVASLRCCKFGESLSSFPMAKHCQSPEDPVVEYSCAIRVNHDTTRVPGATAASERVSNFPWPLPAGLRPTSPRGPSRTIRTFSCAVTPCLSPGGPSRRRLPRSPSPRPFARLGRRSVSQQVAHPSGLTTCGMRFALGAGDIPVEKSCPHGSLGGLTVRTGVSIWSAREGSTPFGPAPAAPFASLKGSPRANGLRPHGCELTRSIPLPWTLRVGCLGIRHDTPRVEAEGSTWGSDGHSPGPHAYRSLK